MDFLRGLVAAASHSRSEHGTDYSLPNQQDPAEFMLALLASIESELQPAGVQRLRQLFQTTVKQVLACCEMTCESPDRTSFHPHQILSLPMEQSTTSLGECMGKFLGQGWVQVIEVSCGFEGCLSNEAEEFQCLHEYPDSMMIQLKRSTVSMNSQNEAVVTKLDQPIRVPREYQPKARGPVYQLTGALYHMGVGISDGHYVSLTYDVEQGCFVFADDDLPLIRMTGGQMKYAVGRCVMFMYCRVSLLPVQRQQSGATQGGHQAATLMPPPPVRPLPLPTSDCDETQESGEDMETDFESSQAQQVLKLVCPWCICTEGHRSLLLRPFNAEFG